MLPAVLLTGIPPQTALGTNKFGSTFGTGIALLNFIQSKKVVWRIAATGVFFTLAGSYLGSRTILIFSNQVVGKIIVFLLPLAVVGILTPHKEQVSSEGPPRHDLLIKVPLICLAIGFYDGFFGPGTGSFLIIIFHILFRMNLVQASATAKVFNLTSNIGALTVFLLEGKVLFQLGVPLALANIIGNYLGSKLAIKKGAKFVKAFLFISISILFASLVWKYFIAGF